MYLLALTSLSFILGIYNAVRLLKQNKSQIQHYSITPLDCKEVSLSALRVRLYCVQVFRGNLTASLEFRILTARQSSVWVRRHLLAFTPYRGNNDGVTGRDDEGWYHEQYHCYKCHVQLPLPLFGKFDPALQTPWENKQCHQMTCRKATLQEHRLVNGYTVRTCRKNFNKDRSS